MSNTDLSIIIPCGPGEQAWKTLRSRLLAEPSRNMEIVISATEPRPQTGLDPDVIWVHGRAGRAEQLNRGIAAGSGRVVWLLHADSLPGPANIAAALQFAALDVPGIGWFDLAFDRDGPRAARLNAWGANLRSRILGLPFGDQGWLMPRAVFARLGGFDPDFGRGEDLDFIVRAHAQGIRLRRLGPTLLTSARRYREHGWWRTSLAHLWLTLCLYRRARQRCNDSR